MIIKLIINMNINIYIEIEYENKQTKYENR
jgi:hypothetical protein